MYFSVFSYFCLILNFSLYTKMTNLQISDEVPSTSVTFEVFKKTNNLCTWVTKGTQNLILFKISLLILPVNYLL